MGTSVAASFSGLASGVQWSGIVDQLISIQTTQQITPLTKAIAAAQSKKSAWNQFNSLVSALGDAANALRSINGFASVSAQASSSPTTNRSLLSMSATSSATAGTYGLEVLSLASNAKVSGSSVADPTTALSLAGNFSINGQAVSVASSDTLQGVRDKINALNSGTTPTKVTATILTTATGQNRLVLASDTSGSSGLTVTDGGSGVAQDLGFLTSKSAPVSSTKTAIAVAMGVSMPPPSNIKVNGQTIAVDLSVDSLSTIAARIQAAGVEAQVVGAPNGAGTAYRLAVGGSVTATSDSNSAATISALGFGAGDLTAAAQQVAAPSAFTVGGSTAQSTDLLSSLQQGGSALGIATGDAINVTGQRGDGSSVSVGITVQAGDTIDTLLARMNSSTDGFGSGSRPATASLGPDGKIRLVDGTGGDSRLGFSLQLVKSSGTTTDLGTGSTEILGRSRQVVAGSDAKVKVDGTTITRSSNTISDAIPGVTLTLQQAEPGTIVSGTVSADLTARSKAVKTMASAYNSIVSFVEAQQVAGQPLASDFGLRSTAAQLLAGLRTSVTGAGDYTQLARTGVALDKYGKLQVDSNALSTMLADTANASTFFDAFGLAMKTSAGNIADATTGSVAITLTSLDTQVQQLNDRQTAAQARIDDQKKQLSKQFTAMEAAISKLNNTGSFLTSQFKQLGG